MVGRLGPAGRGRGMRPERLAAGLEEGVSPQAPWKRDLVCHHPFPVPQPSPGPKGSSRVGSRGDGLQSGAEGIGAGHQCLHHWCFAVCGSLPPLPLPSLTAALPPWWMGSRPIRACWPGGETGHGRLATGPVKGAGPQPLLGEGPHPPSSTPGFLSQPGARP